MVFMLSGLFRPTFRKFDSRFANSNLLMRFLRKITHFRKKFKAVLSTTSTSGIVPSSVGKLLTRAFQCYQTWYRRCPWCRIPTGFTCEKVTKKIEKSRFLRQNRRKTEIETGCWSKLRPLKWTKCSRSASRRREGTVAKIDISKSYRLMLFCSWVVM